MHNVLVHSARLGSYDFGPQHPMAPGRVSKTISLAQALGVLDRLVVLPPSEVDEDLLLRVHTPSYLAAVQRQVRNPRYGIGTIDNPVVPGMHQIAASVAMATVDAARLVWQGQCRAAANIAGGLHHALPSATSGFCVYNDLAVAIRWLLDHGAQRLAYVDIDVHHGDGVQQIFYDDPRVLTISIHQHPAQFFPGTGFPTEVGGPTAVGSAVNVALPAGTGDRGWLRAFAGVVPPLLTAFQPQLIISQHGCDTHALDPLAQLMVSVDAQRALALQLADLAAQLCAGKWVATGGGGYAVERVVPRAWTHLLAAVSGQPLDPSTPIPADWLAQNQQSASATMSDFLAPEQRPTLPSFSQIDPADPVDSAIMATRRAVFPEHGLDPEP